MNMTKKGQIFDQLGGLAVGIAVLAITLVVTFLILSQAKTNMTSSGQVCENSSATYYATNDTCQSPTLGIQGKSNAWNSTGTLQNATQGIPGWIPLVVIAVVGSILLGLVAMFRR